MEKRNIIIFILSIIGLLGMTLNAILLFKWNVTVPALFSSSLVVFAISWAYSSKQQFNEGKINKTMWRLILFMVLSAGTISIITGILQIIDAFSK
jgi:hypothetical protein